MSSAGPQPTEQKEQGCVQNHDEVELFLLSLAPAIRRLSPEMRSLAKVQMLLLSDRGAAWAARFYQQSLNNYSQSASLLPSQPQSTFLQQSQCQQASYQPSQPQSVSFRPSQPQSVSFRPSQPQSAFFHPSQPPSASFHPSQPQPAASFRPSQPQSAAASFQPNQPGPFQPSSQEEMDCRDEFVYS